jgi:hypothetical protein
LGLPPALPVFDVPPAPGLPVVPTGGATVTPGVGPLLGVTTVLLGVTAGGALPVGMTSLGPPLGATPVTSPLGWGAVFVGAVVVLVPRPSLLVAFPDSLHAASKKGASVSTSRFVRISVVPCMLAG